MEVPLLVTDFLRRSTKLYADSEAVVDGDQRFSWREFGERVNQQANALLEMGIGKGDRVAIIAPNSHQFLETFYANRLDRRDHCAGQLPPDPIRLRVHPAALDGAGGAGGRGVHAPG